MFEHDYVFVADEAGISNDRWTVVGGVCMHKSRVLQVLAAMQKYRTDHNMHSELKWTKISNQKQAEYEALVDYFFAMNNTNQIQFHSIIFDSWSNRQGNTDGAGKKGVSYLYSELLLNRFINRCGLHGSLYARLDERSSSISLEEQRKELNHSANEIYGINNNPLKILMSENSKKCDILQLNDVILGAVCSVRNGRYLLPGGRESKKQIATKVLAKSGFASFDIDTPKEISKFTVWHK